MPQRPAITMTRQRRAILDELARVPSHPTVDEVFQMVRVRLPNVSLATVYRNLEMLAEAGLIRRVHTGGSRMRFDAVAADHTHIRCLSCGRVDDARLEPSEDLLRTFSEARGYAVVTCSVELAGYCPGCRAQAAGLRKDSGGSAEE